MHSKENYNVSGFKRNIGNFYSAGLNLKIFGYHILRTHTFQNAKHIFDICKVIYFEIVLLIAKIKNKMCDRLKNIYL
jgi:hypothetical protein